MNQPQHTPAEAVQYWYDAATERREERDCLRAVVARIRQMADCWEQQLPEVIRTPAVVSALRAALEPAAASAVVAPPTDRAAVLRDAIARVRGIPVQCTGLTGPVWFGQGWQDAIGEFEEIAERLADEDQRRLAVEAHDTEEQAVRCPHGCDVTRCPCLACEAEDTEALASHCDHCKQPGHSFEDCPHADVPAPVAQQPAADTARAASCRCHSREGLTPEQHENDCPLAHPAAAEQQAAAADGEETSRG